MWYFTRHSDTSSSNINEKLRQRRAADGKDVPSEDDTIDNIVESGKGLMKGLGGFLNKTAESFDKSRQFSTKQVIARNRKQRIIILIRISSLQ